MESLERESCRPLAGFSPTRNHRGDRRCATARSGGLDPETNTLLTAHPIMSFRNLHLKPGLPGMPLALVALVSATAACEARRGPQDEAAVWNLALTYAVSGGPSHLGRYVVLQETTGLG